MVQSIPGITTFENNTGATLWLKQENNNLNPMPLANGKSTTMRIDGVTHPKYPGQVYKVTNLGNTFGVHVNDAGVFFDGMGMGALNSAGGGGWKGSDWLDQRHEDKYFGWDPIFQKANNP